MKLCVAQSSLGDTVHGRGRDHTAERTRHTVALIVGHDQEHVGRASARYHLGRPVSLRILGILLDHAAKFHGRWWKLFTVNGDGGTR